MRNESGEVRGENWKLFGSKLAASSRKCIQHLSDVCFVWENGVDIHLRMLMDIVCQKVKQIILRFHIVIDNCLVIKTQFLQQNGRYNPGSVFSGSAKIQYVAFCIQNRLNNVVHLFIQHAQIDRCDRIGGLGRVTAAGYRHMIDCEPFFISRQHGVCSYSFFSRKSTIVVTRLCRSHSISSSVRFWGQSLRMNRSVPVGSSRVFNVD